jgi:glucokinase
MMKPAELKKTCILAIDAGGTYFKSIIVSMQGDVHPGSFFQAPAMAAATKGEIINGYGEIISRGLRFAEGKDLFISGIGVSTPGPFDYKQGMSLMKHKFQALRNVPLRDEIYALNTRVNWKKTLMFTTLP